MPTAFRTRQQHTTQSSNRPTSGRPATMHGHRLRTGPFANPPTDADPGVEAGNPLRMSIDASESSEGTEKLFG